jgi:hypothetical protein
MVLHRVWAIRRFLAKVYGGGQYREGKALNFLIHQASVSPLRRCCYPVRAVHSMRNEAFEQSHYGLQWPQLSTERETT